MCIDADDTLRPIAMFVGNVRDRCADIADADQDHVENVLIELGELGDMCSVRLRRGELLGDADAVYFLSCRRNNIGGIQAMRVSIANLTSSSAPDFILLAIHSHLMKDTQLPKGNNRNIFY